MFQAGEQDLVARTDSLEVRFEAATRAISRVENLRTGQVLTDATGSPPWRMVPQGTAWGPVAVCAPPGRGGAVPHAGVAAAGGHGGTQRRRRGELQHVADHDL